MATAGIPSSTSTPSTDLHLLGPIVRLQVQSESLKEGTRPHSRYDPGHIEVVDALVIDGGGVTGFHDGSSEPLADVHHRDHPRTKYRGENGISVGFTSHYRQMRERFGDHVVDGIGGENVLIRTGGRVPIHYLAMGLIAITRDGPVALGAAAVAVPCIEFSKFCCGYPPERTADAEITEALRFLNQGTRGFYLTGSDSPESAHRLSTGDLVYARTSVAP